MSKIGGLKKSTQAANRYQQKLDWALILKAVGKEYPAPDWANMRVVEIDKYMQDVCDVEGLDHLDFFGRG